MDEKFEVELLKDTLEDLRNQNKFIKCLVKILCAVIIFFILALAGLFVYSHERFVKFVLDYDVSITSSITLDNNSQNDGNIAVDRK